MYVHVKISHCWIFFFLIDLFSNDFFHRHRKQMNNPSKIEKLQDHFSLKHTTDKKKIFVNSLKQGRYTLFHFHPKIKKNKKMLKLR